MLVLDASAAVDLLLAHPVDERLVARVGDDGDLHAPHLIDVEVLSALRRLVATGELTAEVAAVARRHFGELPIERYPHTHLVDRMWELRHSITAYDATYVALAELLGCPLVTTDIRLARATAHRVTVEGHGPSAER